MAVGALDRSPPPFFRQGPSALTKMLLCASTAVFLMAADTRFNLTAPLRATIATLLLPAQQAMKLPQDAVRETAAYGGGLTRALRNEAAAQELSARLAERAARTEQLQTENNHLRALLGLREAISVRSISADVLFEASDPFSRKVFIDRGLAHGVKRGAPVIHEFGVLGQVTEVYPMSALVTFLTDKDAILPVLNARSRHRAVAYGVADGSGMELRFVAPTADVQRGDRLQTSGIDGVYPPGLAVGVVKEVERRSDTGFARIKVEPLGRIDGVRHVLVLEPLSAGAAAMIPQLTASAPAGAASAAAAAGTASAAPPTPARAGGRR